MMYIRIEMWPKGDRKRANILAEATVENIGGTKTRAGYLARLSKRGGFKGPKGSYQDPELNRICKPAESSVWKSTEVHDFPRKALGIWDLLLRALHPLLGDRNGSV